jgi:hypothetical protein
VSVVSSAVASSSIGAAPNIVSIPFPSHTVVRVSIENSQSSNSAYANVVVADIPVNAAAIKTAAIAIVF